MLLVFAIARLPKLLAIPQRFRTDNYLSQSNRDRVESGVVRLMLG